MLKYLYLLAIVLGVATAVENTIVPNGGPKNIELFLKEHNGYRRDLGKGLSDLTWDENLVSIAEKSALKCEKKFGQPDGLNKNSPGSTSPGELSYIGRDGGSTLNSRDFLRFTSLALQQWNVQGAAYDYNRNQCRPRKICHEFTQMMWKQTKKVGCALASCPNYSPVIWGWSLVCEYYPTGNIEGQRPY